MALWWPLDDVRVTGEWANSPEFYAQFGQQGHNGIDLGAGVGTPVFAADAGVVDFEGWGQNHPWMGSIAGICVILRHPWGYTGYAHLSNTVIDRGQSISKGQLIGHSGATGVGTGPHLHFETLPGNPNFGNGFAGRVNPHTYGLEPRGGAPAPAPASNQRVTGSEPVNRRVEPNTSKPAIDPMLAPNTVADFNGWIRGENVAGNDVWFRGAHSGNWFWSGGFTSQSTDGLQDLNPVTPPPAPTPTPEPTPQPTPEPTPGRKPVSETTPNWDAVAPKENPVYPLPISKPSLKLPDTIGERVEAVSVNGYTIGRPDPAGANHIVLHHAATSSLDGAINTLRGANGSPTASYVVKDRDLVSMVPEGSSPWTNGRWTSNLYSVTFEMVNESGSGSTWQPPSKETMETTAWAMARAAQRWNIEAPLEYGINVFGHRDVSKSATACPGDLDMKAVVARANDILVKNPVRPEPSTGMDLEAIAEHLDAISALLKAGM